MHNYSSLQENNDHDEEGGVLVHVAEPSRARWNHIEDLDTFFSRMYHYHQKHGFFCMLLQEILELIQFVFIVFLTSYVIYGINYPVLFRYQNHPYNGTKITLNDVTYSMHDCISHFNLLAWFLLVIALIVWIMKLIKGVYHLFYFWDIKQFFNTALKIEDKELDNLTWHEVQSRVRAVQIEQQMCIHKKELSELDIYHRILRQQNYLVAMVNKRLLPARLKIKFIGEVVYWTTALQYNIQLLFFWSPWAPFENPWHLREEYKKPNSRHDLAKQFGKQILYLVLVNVFFAPLIFLWQILYTIFSYAAIAKRDPAILIMRRWSLYGRLYLRHFNELEHELQARLTRAHRPATKYLSAFSSPIATIISDYVGFFAMSLLTVFFFLTLYSEDVLTVEHVITIMAVLTAIVAVTRGISPDETMSWDLEQLLANVAIHTHYLPTGWKGAAHTSRIQKEFEQMFQFGFVGLLEGILSPILTPYILLYHMYPRALDFVDFFRNFTVSVVGVGDVCSFAQMDVKKHGNPDWQGPEINQVTSQYEQGEDGKVEMSLMHFTYTNPSWRPPIGSVDFVTNVQQQSSLIARSTGDLLMHRNLDDSILSERPDLNQGDVWRLSTTEVPMHGSGMWRNEGPSLSSAREMMLSASFLQNRHYNKTGGSRLRSTAEETTPLLSHH